MGNKLFITFILVIFLISLTSASPFGYDYLEHATEGVISGANYSINVNNSNYLQGYTPTTLKDWIQGLFDSVYCKLTGCEMTGNISSTQWFKGLFNWTTTDDWSSFDGSTFDFNESKLSTQYFLASAINLITGSGAGNLEDIQTYNRTTYNVTETNSDFELIVNFTGITEFTTLLVRHKTDESDGHSSLIQIWDYTDSSWEGYGYLSELTTSKMQTFGIYDDSEHIEDGVVQVRFYLNEVGNAGHVHQFDWVGLSKGFGTPVGTEVDPLSFHRDENLDNSDYNITANTFIISNGTATTTHWNMYEDGNGTLVWEQE